MSTETDRYPNGWFPVACSDEVPTGRVFTGRLAGEDVVVYRTGGGLLRATRPYCPHLGAHLGHGGLVAGEDIVCPFHHFAFGPSGDCVRTPYGKPPPRASLALIPTFEANGLIFAWRHAGGAPPTWEPVRLPTDGFTKPTAFQIASAGNPEDLVENLVDTGHFGPVHNTAVNLVSTVPDGPYMRVSVDLTGVGELGFFKERYLHRLRFLEELRGSAEFTCSGVGLVSSVVSVPAFDLQLAQAAALTPEEPGRVRLRLTTSARIGSRAGAALAPALSHLVSLVTKRQVKQDYLIWENRRPTALPKIAAGDGPIMLMRRWAQQFWRLDDAGRGHADAHRGAARDVRERRAAGASSGASAGAAERASAQPLPAAPEQPLPAAPEQPLPAAPEQPLPTAPEQPAPPRRCRDVSAEPGDR
ncbi:Rieske 2Fe-2S domain-containing protein [Streptomyces sp. DSM 118878]